MKTRSNLRYIYNPNQRDYFDEKGAKMLRTGINPTSGRRYWVYDYQATESIFDSWCKKCRMK